MEETSWSMTRWETQEAQDRDSCLRLGGSESVVTARLSCPSQRRASRVTDVVLNKELVKWGFFPKLLTGQNWSRLWGKAEFGGMGRGAHLQVTQDMENPKTVTVQSLFRFLHISTPLIFSLYSETMGNLHFNPLGELPLRTSV